MVDGRTANHPGTRAFVSLAAFVIVAGGMKMAASIVVPILAAIFIAVISVPPTAALVRIGIRRWLAAMLVFSVVVLLGLAASAVIASTATSFTEALPAYEETLKTKLADAVAWLNSKGARLTVDQVDDILDPTRLFPYIQQTLSALVGLLQSTVFVLLTVIFILMEATVLPDKIRAITRKPNGSAGDRDPVERWRGVLEDLQGYLVVKTYTSGVTGILAGLGCWFFGVPYPMVLGLIAFVLNYVPSLSDRSSPRCPRSCLRWCWKVRAPRSASPWSISRSTSASEASPSRGSWAAGWGSPRSWCSSPSSSGASFSARWACSFRSR